MSQEVRIDVRLGDDDLTQKLKEQIRLAEQLKETLAGTGAGAPSQRSGGPATSAAPPPSVAPPPSPSAAPTPSAAPAPSAAPTARAGGDRARAIGAGVQSFATQTSAGGLISDLGGQVSKLPFGVGALAGTYLGLKGTSLSAREAQASQIAGLEQLEAGLAGVLDFGITPNARGAGEMFTDQLKGLGFGAAEARTLATSSASAYGRAVDDVDMSGAIKGLGAAQRAGIPAALLTSLAGAITQNSGRGFPEAVELAQEMRNLAEKGLDLRGAGVQQFLAGVAGYTSQLTSQGVQTAPRTLGDTIRGISRTTGAKGSRPLEIMQGLGGIAQGARGALAAPFAGLAQTAVMAEAYATASNPLEAIARAEEIMADPARVQEAITAAFGGGETGALALAAGAPIGTGEARKLAAAQTLRAGGREGARLSAAQLEAGLTITAAQAAQGTETTRAVRADEAVLKTLVETSGTLQRSVLNLTSSAQAMTDLAAKVADALNLAAKWLP